MEGYADESYGEAFADVYDDWYGEITDVDATVARLVALAGTGPVLELGVGTGRLAIPLAARGLTVSGVDNSAAMLTRLAAKPGAESVRALHGPMDDPPVGAQERFGLVFAAYNTFFNLTSEAGQRRCFVRVAELLESGASFVIEAFVPGGGLPGPAGDVSVRDLAADRALLSLVRHDPIAQRLTGQLIELTERGNRLRPWQLRYAPPAELDTMAADAGLELAERHAGWSGEPYEPTSVVHVSRWRRPR